MLHGTGYNGYITITRSRDFLCDKAVCDVGSKGRAMAQAVSRRLLTAEALIVFRRDGICGGRSSSKFFCLFFFSSEHLGFPCLYRSTYAPYFFCPLWDGQWSH
jgi:hypothetical protein